MKVVFIDIDGTLRNSKRELTTKTIETIKKVREKGTNCYICSGRPRQITLDISKEAGLGPYIISTTGADIYNFETNETIYQNRISKESLEFLYNLAIKKDFQITFQSGFDLYTNKKTKPHHASRLDLPEDLNLFFERTPISQVILVSQKKTQLKSVIEKINSYNELKVINGSKSLFYTNCKSQTEDEYYLDVNTKTENKGKAVKTLCEKLGIKKSNCICIGDDMNDYEMLKFAGKAVVMDNAKEEIKALADEITLSNDKDGVAFFLEKEFLNKKNIE